MTHDGTKTYDWGPSGELIKISWPSGKTITYFYNGFGLLYRRFVKNGATVASDTRYAWCGNHICQEQNATNQSIVRRYVDGEVTSPINGKGAFLSPQTFSYFKDHLGSVRDVIQGVGTFVAGYSYDEWGTRTQRFNNLAGFDLTVGYTGHFYDTDAQ
ncbi:MAG: hypothetical protein FIA97_09680 [Methylococcaceae bacterium]|nr:hypothetical protein [Methylococcaceae bacterium]